MNERTTLDAAASIADPIERARSLTGLIGDYQQLVTAATVMRREAVGQALAGGMTQDQVARAIGVTPGRISQMRKAAGEVEIPPPVVSGWNAEAGPAAAHIAICGSRAPGTNAEQLAAAVPALAELLMRRRYAVSHGPVGVGAEVLTYVADQHHPAGLDSVRGIIGHANVVRDAEYVLVVGGGSGTQGEADTALSAGKRVLPMPLSGGAAARVYMRMLGDAALRAWLSDATFSALATASADRYAELAEAVIAKEG